MQKLLSEDGKIPSDVMGGALAMREIDGPKPADILASFQRFYFDTALSSSPAALPSLKSFAKNGRILFGSDFPFAPADQPEAMRGLCFRVSP